MGQQTGVGHRARGQEDGDDRRAVSNERDRPPAGAADGPQRRGWPEEALVGESSVGDPPVFDGAETPMTRRQGEGQVHVRRAAPTCTSNALVTQVCWKREEAIHPLGNSIGSFERALCVANHTGCGLGQERRLMHLILWHSPLRLPHTPHPQRASNFPVACVCVACAYVCLR